MTQLFLVTGGAGFIGSHLTARLLADGGRVRVLDNFSTGSLANLPAAGPQAANLEIIRGDLRDLQAVERAAAGATVIFHQAAMRSVQRSVADPLGANEHNVTGTLHVFEAARRAGVRRVVYASSSPVYVTDLSCPSGKTRCRSSTPTCWRPSPPTSAARCSTSGAVSAPASWRSPRVWKRFWVGLSSAGARRPDVSKGKRLLGYTPFVGFDEGLTRTVEYFRAIASGS